MPAALDPAPSLNAGDVAPPRLEAVPSRFTLHAHPVPLRLLGALAKALAGANLLLAAALLLLGGLSGAQPPGPFAVARELALFSLLPLAILFVVQRIGAATVDVEASRLVITRREARFEVPLESVAAARPWRLPLPGPGLSLRMKSGRRFTYGLETAELSSLLAALRSAGVAGAAPEHPMAAWAQARLAAAHGRRFYALKYGLFPLAPAALLFRLHQYIEYGGWLGQYYSLGLKAYLGTLAHDWLDVELQLVLYASVWRALIEAVAISAAWLAPARARTMRRSAEIACHIVYYVGIPALLAFLLLA